RRSKLPIVATTASGSAIISYASRARWNSIGRSQRRHPDGSLDFSRAVSEASRRRHRAPTQPLDQKYKCCTVPMGIHLPVVVATGVVLVVEVSFELDVPVERKRRSP